MTQLSSIQQENAAEATCFEQLTLSREAQIGRSLKVLVLFTEPMMGALNHIPHQIVGLVP